MGGVGRCIGWVTVSYGVTSGFSSMDNESYTTNKLNISKFYI